MSKYYVEYRKKWFKLYVALYKEGNRIERKAIKRVIYDNVKLTEEEKDKIWSDIIRIGFLVEN